MKKLLRKLFLFSLPFLVVFLGIEVFYRTVPNNYSFKHKTVQQNYDSTEVLILGGSHTFYGLNPKYFEKKTFNLGNLSQSLYFDELLLEKHLNHFKKLQCVILNIEYFSLSQADTSAENNSRKYYYHGFMNLDVPLVAPTDPKGVFLSTNRSFERNLNLINKYISKGTLLYCDENGFGTDYTKVKSRNIDKTLETTLKAHEDHLTDFSKNNSRLQHMITLCKNRNIKVLLVTMPVVEAYANGVDQNKLQRIFETCQNLEKQNSNVRYLNLFQDKRFKTEDFYDADHLHTDGAVKCSGIVSGFVDGIVAH